MRLRATLFLLTAITGPSTIATAQPAPAQAGQVPKKALDPNEIVCEKQPVPGSRLATKRVCMTRSQWADLKAQDRQEIEKAQVQRGMRDQ